MSRKECYFAIVICVYALSFRENWTIAWSPESRHLEEIMNNVTGNLNNITPNVSFVCKYNQDIEHNECLSPCLCYV